MLNAELRLEIKQRQQKEKPRQQKISWFFFSRNVADETGLVPTKTNNYLLNFRPFHLSVFCFLVPLLYQYVTVMSLPVRGRA